jgi:hypothetical protein
VHDQGTATGCDRDHALRDSGAVPELSAVNSPVLQETTMPAIPAAGDRSTIGPATSIADPSTLIGVTTG